MTHIKISPIDTYWNLKLEAVKENLENNNFEVHIAQTAEAAKEIALNNIIPGLDIKSVSWGGSMSFIGIGLFHALNGNKELEVINTFDKSLSMEQMLERRRQSLLVDLLSQGPMPLPKPVTCSTWT